ncbi:SDR family oxidoreductase [Clostridium formicaceticum]|uniref:Short chain dehydrogenase n=2 Tax=Clostridium formicaceticum TaxID=1497 RepID=A0AAC9RFS5_9CLOT|nr:NAD(P)H-binding protein [Clostridium formicaceticum]ARE85909.1 short chain dehydrogenase [Clostridium formicaceticum]
MLLVTGITGHTGRYFLQELINNKYEGPIRCIVRETSNTSLLDNSGLNIEKVVGDLNDKTFIENAMEGIDTIMHIYNIHHSPTILQVAIEDNVKRAILVHTTGIYSNFKYASQGYRDIESKVSEMTSNLDCSTKVTILRPTMIYGDLCDSNMSKFIKMIDKFRIMPVINGGKSLIQPVNARDLGKAFYTVLMSSDKTSGKAYDLSGEKPLQMIEVFKLIRDNLNKKTIFVSVPIGFGVFLARVVKVFSLGRVDYVEKVQRMAEDRSYSHEEAKSDFNYKPMSFEDGIQIEVKQYLKKRGE